jgi:hypothetical protein
MMFTLGEWRNGIRAIKLSIDQAVDNMPADDGWLSHEHFTGLIQPDRRHWTKSDPKSRMEDDMPFEESAFNEWGGICDRKELVAKLVPREYMEQLALRQNVDQTWDDRKLSPSEIYKSRACIAFQTLKLYSGYKEVSELEATVKELLHPGVVWPGFETTDDADEAVLSNAWIPPIPEPPLEILESRTGIGVRAPDGSPIDLDPADIELVVLLAQYQGRGRTRLSTKEVRDEINKEPSHCFQSAGRKAFKNDFIDHSQRGFWGLKVPAVIRKV